MRFLIVALAFLLASPAFAEEPKTLYWPELLPEGELERLLAAPEVDHYSDDAPPQIGTFNVVSELDGKLVRIPGFVLPFEYVESGNVTEFLLVPYFGACIHSPPPPPNQLVYVKTKKPTNLGKQWDAIWAVGILRTQKHLNDLGDAAYTLELIRWEEYNDDYS